MAKTYPSKLSDLRSRVYDRIHADSSSAKHQATDAKILAALNDGQREVQNELLLAFDTRYFTRIESGLTPTNNRIELPDDFKRLVLFERSTGSDWEAISVVSPVEHERYNVSEFPKQEGAFTTSYEAWSVIGDHLQAHGSATRTGTYRIVMQYQVPDLQSDDDICKIPDEYQESVVLYAAWTMEEDSNHKQRAESLRHRYENKVEQMHRTAKILSTATPRRVRMVHRGFRRWR